MLRDGNRQSGQLIHSLRAMCLRHTMQRRALLLHSKPAIAVAASTALRQAVLHGARFRLEVLQAQFHPKVHRAKFRPQILPAKVHQVHRVRQARLPHLVRQVLLPRPVRQARRPLRPVHRVPHQAVRAGSITREVKLILLFIIINELPSQISISLNTSLPLSTMLV